MTKHITIEGKHNTAKVFNPDIDDSSYQQINRMMDREEFKDSKFRFMPDVHYGKGSTIGTTMTVDDKITANYIGVDIGCGVNVTELTLNKKEASDPEFLKKFDRNVRQNVPLGFKRHQKYQEAPEVKREEFIVADQLEDDTYYKSIGSLGGGNHFVSLEASNDGKVYLIIHSGSRNVGHTVATLYQDKADELNPGENKGEGILEGDLLEDYLHDLELAQKYALQNRRAMAKNILESNNLDHQDQFDTVHNYIEMATMIARKGAVSAHMGEKLIIPFNARDGSIIAEGKGNADWNYSAPHGAGRTMSRTRAKKNISLQDYQEMMKDVYSTSVSKQTLDEAPTAYNDQRKILKLAKPTIKIIDAIRPIYNLKG